MLQPVERLSDTDAAKKFVDDLAVAVRQCGDLCRAEITLPIGYGQVEDKIGKFSNNNASLTDHDAVILALQLAERDPFLNGWRITVEYSLSSGNTAWEDALLSRSDLKEDIEAILGEELSASDRPDDVKLVATRK